MNIREIVKNYIISNFLEGDSQKITDTQQLFEGGLGFDSIQLLELVEFLEVEFAITIPDKEFVVDYFATIECIEKFVKLKLKMKQDS